MIKTAVTVTVKDEFFFIKQFIKYTKNLNSIKYLFSTMEAQNAE